MNRRQKQDFAWTAEPVATLRLMWDEGRPTAQIGRLLGISKNAVVGKAHRLQLPSRPSPVIRDGVVRPKAAARGRPIPRLGELQLPMPTRIRADRAGASAPTVAAPRQADPALHAPCRPAAPERLDLRVRPTQPCCWPIGEPGQSGFRFCDAPSLGTKPYCAEHAARAYVRHRPGEIGVQEDHHGAKR